MLTAVRERRAETTRQSEHELLLRQSVVCACHPRQAAARSAVPTDSSMSWAMHLSGWCSSVSCGRTHSSQRSRSPAAARAFILRKQSVDAHQAESEPSVQGQQLSERRARGDAQAAQGPFDRCSPSERQVEFLFALDEEFETRKGRSHNIRRDAGRLAQLEVHGQQLEERGQAAAAEAAAAVAPAAAGSPSAPAGVGLRARLHQ